MNKSGQVSIFVIVAIVIVAAVVVVFAVRGNFGIGSVPRELEPVFSAYSACIDESAREGIALSGLQGGRIDVGEIEQGSEYAPFSSHLFAFGSAIPYWYRLSGNGVTSENVPTRGEMERDIADFISSRLGECDLSSFYEQGFSVEFGEPVVKVDVGEGIVDVVMSQEMDVSKGDLSGKKGTHKISVESELGTMYSQAIEIYNSEKRDVFLENYSVDVLRSYAPVDGVSVQCAPEIWKTGEVVDGLKNALADNLARVKFKGDYYVSGKDDGYFVVNTPVSHSTRVIYSPDWASRIEITPADDNFMIAEPLGNQEGLGVMGFCYVPYHFVYDVSFPALIQIGDGPEFFQFPVVVIVDKNLPRMDSGAQVDDLDESDICSFKNGRATIRVFDENLNPVPEARISYQCLEQSCALGTSKIFGEDSVLEADVPLCLNGQIIASADGYLEGKQIFSSNSEESVDLILQKSYPVNVRVKVDGRDMDGTAIVHFTDERGSVSALLPDNSRVELGEGLYNMSVFVYGNSSVVIPASTKQECTQVARGGLSGVFGGTEQRCFDIAVPETRIDYALRGGGTGTDYLTASDLESGELVIYVNGLPAASTLEQLQYNFEIFNSLHAEVGSA